MDGRYLPVTCKSELTRGGADSRPFKIGCMARVSSAWSTSDVKQLGPVKASL